MMIVDAHCHYGLWNPPASLRDFRPLQQQLRSCEAVSEYMGANNLSAVILVPHYSPGMTESAFWGANNGLIGAIDRLDRAYGAILVSPDADWSSTDPAVERLLTHQRVVAIKVAPNTWREASLDPSTWSAQVRRRMECIIDLSTTLKLPIQTHTGGGNSHVRHLLGFVRKFGRTVDLHCVHMGGKTSGHFAFVPAFCEWMQEGLRVYCDFSWARPFASRWIVRELKRRGLRIANLLFASDEPWGSLPMEIARIRELDLSDQERDAVFGQNALALYSLGDMQDGRDC